MSTKTSASTSSKPSHNRSAAARIGFVSLGCPKTLVDSEVMLGHLAEHGFQLADDPEHSDIVVINTCSFIQDSIQESIDTIMSAATLKREGKIRGIVVTGCLAQRFKDELPKELHEVDGFLGTSHFEQLPAIVERVLNHERVVEIPQRPGPVFAGTPTRRLLTAPHVAYVKISEGCDHRCSFCTIPSFRGDHRSRAMEDIVAEVERLVREHGTQEVILVGQDTTLYGIDRYESHRLPELLRRVAAAIPNGWVRLLYTYPTYVTDDMIAAFAEIPNLCKYLDMPLQHINNTMLRRMARLGTKEEIDTLLDKIRRTVPGVAIRTTFIVGFPGETDAAFEELVAFVQAQRFERLGVFRYSPEPGTPSALFDEQIPDTTKQARFARLMSVQQAIAESINRSRLGQTLRVLVDEMDASDPTIALARTEADAPEVDGQVFVRTTAPIAPGTWLRVRVVDTYEYDLVVEPVAGITQHATSNQ